MFSTGVETGEGLTVLILPKAKPKRPSAVSRMNSGDNDLANSTAWFLMVKPPMVTLSVPTVSDVKELSPYEIFHFEPGWLWNVDDFFGLKILWVTLPCCCTTDDGNSVDQ